MPIPLLLDTDIGDDVDDVFALLQAALHPDLSLRGVTTVLGETAHRARICKKMLELAGRPDVPVAIGRSHTLSDRTRPPFEHSATGFVGPEGSDEWNALGARLEKEDAPDFLIESIRTAPEPPIMCTIGPVTNLAIAIQRAPDIVSKVRGFVFAGGRLGPDADRGNYNFGWDHEGVRTVLFCGGPMKIGTNDITEQVTFRTEHVPRLLAGTPAARAAGEQLAKHLRLRQRERTPMYDPVALTLAYTDQYVKTQPVALTTTSVGEKLVMGIDEGKPPMIDASVAIDVDATTEHILQVVGAAGPASA